MSSPLPALDLGQARRRAKELLAAARAGDTDAVRRLRRSAPRLADAQHAVAREHGFATWGDLVRAHEDFPPADADALDWRRVREVVVVCLPHAGQVTLYRDGDRWATPRGPLLDGEDAWDDTVMRVCLATMGFRRQGTHLLATDRHRRTAVFWVDGADYHGTRPHRTDAETWTAPADEAAAALRAAGDGALARLVERAAHDQATMTYERHARDLRRTLSGAYLAAPTRPGGSGFGGSDDDWTAARGPLAEALAGLPERLGRQPVSFLDVGCANGHLSASMVAWGAAAGIAVEPWGLDVDPALVARAAALHPQWADRFATGDAVDWRARDGRTFDLVHLLLDVLPDGLHARVLGHWRQQVTPGGRLLVSMYDVRPERSARAMVEAAGYRPDGVTSVPRRADGQPYHAGSVWLDR